MSLSTEQRREIEERYGQTVPTRRAVSEGSDPRLFSAHSVLDHGFVRVLFPVVELGGLLKRGGLGAA
ncbi:hypothetical protein Q5Y75_06470 [Ruegeria sp. 2205SS24-7]|uniref:hypothetical protein n=1 Tax=Ruegeria discodermiae TaxID=3064389 RepID=UPI002742038C|nr:hypothetical protein [Ruegeria sp. 2205SS24-7]MDP5216858.1 hypothetical protein [Ruegeria sp. 2205SS24-7]